MSYFLNIIKHLKPTIMRASQPRRLMSSDVDRQATKSEVKNLYKNLLYLSRDWHYDLKPQLREAFKKNKDIQNPEEIRKLIEKGEYISREIIATYQLKKYRTLKRRYLL